MPDVRRQPLSTPPIGPHMNALHDSVLDAWRSVAGPLRSSSSGSGDLWPLGLARRSPPHRPSIAVHLHNCRCLWMNSLAKQSGITIPRRVGRATVTQSGSSQHLPSVATLCVASCGLRLENGGVCPRRLARSSTAPCHATPSSSVGMPSPTRLTLAGSSLSRPVHSVTASRRRPSAGFGMVVPAREATANSTLASNPGMQRTRYARR